MKQKRPQPMIGGRASGQQRPTQSPQSQKRDRPRGRAVDNVRADEQPLFDDLARLHKEQPDPDRYREELARIMLLHLKPAAEEAILDHIDDNRVVLAQMQDLKAWARFFRAGILHWLEEIFIPEQVEQIGGTAESWAAEGREHIAYSESRAAMHAVTLHSNMGRINVLCAQMVIVLNQDATAARATGQEQG